MTKKFCDRCNKDITRDQCVVYNPDTYSGKQNDVCSPCRHAILEAFKVVMAFKQVQ